ncbi:MAG TPA: NUDIX domain-containing protein [Acetobacteraceae bacterium]|nr:NUDIX domain-containing protein [Acetobacteraceae bacterium]
MNARAPKARPLPSFPGVDILGEETVWNGRFPLQRVTFRKRRFDGGEGGVLTWELWRRGFAVAVLPYDPWSDRVALIEQFRIAALAAGINPVVTECPAGLLDPGESEEATATRELQEETGLQANRLARIGKYILTQGGCDETISLFAGRVRLPEPGVIGDHGLAHEHEDIRLRVVPADEAIAMLDDNRIENATAALCLGWLARRRDALRREWTSP